MAPPTLACRLQSLPPILDNLSRTPISSCSKGSRGLSVQPRVLGIFTETTVSPDPSKRQRPSRYAIRAGRNFAFTLHFWRRRLSLHLDESLASISSAE
uniref:Lipoprotein, putative n=1 Tax=uncultured bacterium 5G12 TaxID=1701325 RepID=A0A0N9HR98_9BACT|nr:lipoprotein, putative [uncultured bacterium 5G12]